MATTVISSNHHLYELQDGDPASGEVPARVSVDTVYGEHLDAGSGQALLVAPDGREIALSTDLFNLLEAMIRQIRGGRAVQIVVYDKDLTTQQAADILNVSRQYLIRLLERGEIPFTRTEGAHRRIKLADVLEYRRRLSTKRRDALGRIAREALEAGTY